MYIRIEKQIIRYRISRQEANRLIEGEELLETTHLSDDYSLTYGVKTTGGLTGFSFNSKDGAGNTLSVTVNKQQLLSEIEGRPSKQGIAIATKGGKQALSVYLAVNLKIKLLKTKQ